MLITSLAISPNLSVVVGILLHWYINLVFNYCMVDNGETFCQLLKSLVVMVVMVANYVCCTVVVLLSGYCHTATLVYLVNGTLVACIAGSPLLPSTATMVNPVSNQSVPLRQQMLHSL